jgi:hypothetical protein
MLDDLILKVSVEEEIEDLRAVGMGAWRKV